MENQGTTKVVKVNLPGGSQETATKVAGTGKGVIGHEEKTNRQVAKDTKEEKERKSRMETECRNKGNAKPKSRSGSVRTKPSGAGSVTLCAPLPPPLVKKFNTMSGGKVVLPGPTPSHTSESSSAELRKWREPQMTGLGSPYSHATPSTTGGVVMAGGTRGTRFWYPLQTCHLRYPRG